MNPDSGVEMDADRRRTKEANTLCTKETANFVDQNFRLQKGTNFLLMQNAQRNSVEQRF
jgi:hypothetical protein